MLPLPPSWQRPFQRAPHHCSLPTRVCRLGFQLHVWCAALVLFTSFTSVRAQPANRPASTVTGSGELVMLGFRDAANRYYDYVRLTGATTNVKPAVDTIARTFFIDHNDDIVAVDFSGAGNITFSFESVTGPAAPAKYNPISFSPHGPSYSFVKGHATLTVQESDSTTSLGILTLGRSTISDPTIFRSNIDYDGIADLKWVRIVTASKSAPFGALHSANVRFTGSIGGVGISASAIQFSIPVSVYDIDASESGVPMLTLGGAHTVFVRGGDLLQSNGNSVIVQGISSLSMQAGANSHDIALPAQPLRGLFSVSGTAAPFVVTPLAATFTAQTRGSYFVPIFGSPAPTFSFKGTVPSWLTINAATGEISGIPPDGNGSPFSVSVSSSNGVGASVEASLALAVKVPPYFISQPAAAEAVVGTPVTLSATASGDPQPNYQWRKNGVEISGAASSSLTISALLPEDSGAYSVVATNSIGALESSAVVLAAKATTKVAGAAEEIGSDIRHPNGNRYDQALLRGASALIRSEDGDVTRLSFIDLSDDIVQVEFAGAGTLSLALENASLPAAPLRYNQPSVQYVKGHARIVISGADETTNLSIFTVGRATAFDPTGAFNLLLPISASNNPANNGSALFNGHAGTDYDGVADLASVTISSTNGKFGGVRTANASYSNTSGSVGIYAPGIAFAGPVFVGDISASESAIPMLVLGSASDVRITGGDLQQPNNRPVAVKGIPSLQFRNGSTSHGQMLPAQSNRSKLEQDGVDVTSAIVQAPAP